MDNYEQDQKDWEAYKEFIEKLGMDEIYADFDIEIQTNSTLPMDRQSLANLMMRLFELDAVDAKALLEILRIPKAEEIVDRLEQMQKTQPGG